MKFSKIIFASAAALFSINTFALSDSMPFQFSLTAGYTYTLPLQKLHSTTKNNVFCTLKGSKTSAQSSAIEIKSKYSVAAVVDGKTFGPSQLMVARTKLSGSRLTILSVDRNDEVSIKNLDYTDTVEFNCGSEVVESGHKS